MYYLMEELARERERELAARTRAPLFAQDLRPVRGSAVRGRRGARRLPALSVGKWRHWAARGAGEVHCSRAASLAGSC